MTKLLILPFFLLSFNVMANCTINFFDFTYYNDSNNLNVKNFIKSSTCSKDVNNKVYNLLQETAQWGYARHIQTVLQEQEQLDVTVQPRKFFIGPLEQLLAASLKLSDKTKIKIENGTAPSLVQFASNQRPAISTQNLNNGRQQVHIRQGMKNSWFTIQTLIERQVPIASQTIMPYAPLHDIKWEKRWVSAQEDFIDSKNLEFYQSNKNIKWGSPIKRSDIFPRTLVKAGVPTKITLQNGAIKLETTALPYSSGKYGDSIMFRNLKTGKKISAKVINENEAVVQL